MKHLYLIQQSRLKLNWSSLTRLGLRIVLITNAVTRNKINEIDAAKIDRIIITDNFQFDTLLKFIESDSRSSEKDLTFVTTDEFLVMTVSQLNEHFGVQGIRPTQAENYLNKARMKEALAHTSTRCPRFVRFDPQAFAQNGEQYIDRIIAQTGLPCFIKPLSAAGAIGTARIESRDQLLNWAKTQPGDYDYEIDEFVQGELYHCDSLVVDGKIILTMSGKYFFPLASFFENKVCGSIALSLNDPIHLELSALNEAVLQALGMANGVYHLEAFKTSSGELVFLEVGARPAGALVPEMYEKSFGISIHETHILAQTFGEVPKDVKKLRECFWMWIPPQPGILLETHALPIRSQHEYVVHRQSGDQLNLPKEIVDRVSSLLVWDSSSQQIQQEVAVLSDGFRFFDLK